VNAVGLQSRRAAYLVIVNTDRGSHTQRRAWQIAILALIVAGNTLFSLFAFSPVCLFSYRLIFYISLNKHLQKTKKKRERRRNKLVSHMRKRKRELKTAPSANFFVFIVNERIFV